ncbi:receptor-type tyrosine-protein phosphatase epsilon-like isoform X2 [Littorina saxatilis]|uniref:receptor-type tyrosine-protein phosphatase epsilon-like isoform X2 n=1 Tax=Littorina saxatilis TaxID=31220 RepID=UPI0038B43B48
MRFCCGWQNTVLISRMRCSSVFLSVVLFTLFCQTAESAAGQCEKNEKVIALCKEKQLEYFNKSSNNKLEDGDETTCLGAQKEKKIRVKLKEKRTSKAFVQVYLSGSIKYFNCTIANADQCSSFVETKVTGGYVVKSAQCSPATKPPRLVKLKCNGNKADLRKLKLCEIRVYSLTADCEDYWWDAEGRCFKKCNCLDGAKCDQWNGTCPRGKEITTELPTTASPSARVTSSPSPPHTPSPLPPSTTTPLSSTERATTTKRWDTTSPRAATTTSTPQHGISTSSTTTQQPTQTPTIGGTGTEGDTEMPEAPGGNPVQTGKSENSNGGVEMLPVILGMSAMVLLALVILAAVGLRRVVQKGRNKSEELVAHEDTGAADPENQTTALQVEMKDLNGPSSSSPVEGQGQDSMYANVSETFSPTTEPTEEEAFRAHICQMTAIGGFDKEFQALPKGIQDQVTVANKVNGEEKKKNRFRDILPYDDSRVLLAKESDTDCDYINASYIDGFVESMAYIAAQGPLVDTLRDFWHMVWTDNCGKIVMLTNLCEGAKIKCEQYWPVLEGTSCTFGCYTIMSTKVTQKAQFIHRVLSVTKAVDQASESETAREIHQFHFTSWPDHGVPCAVALVQFWSCVISQPSPLTGPLLVHCSAGIGRTGTFIALDMLSYQVETTGKVSVFPTVKRLRKQRVNMVQTVSQYKFLHEVVGEWLAGRDTQVKREELVSDSPWTKKEEPGEGESGGKIPSAVRKKIRTEFEMLTQLRPEVTDDQVSTAKLEENSQKNRSLQVLPVEQYRVRLWTIEDNESDYINAVFLPSLTRQQGYIVTQLPLEGTVGDFWRMVLDWRVKVVVRFMDTPEDEGVPVFPTEGEQVQHGPVNIHTLTKSTSSPGVTAYTLQLKRTEDTETRREESCNKIVTVYCVESPGALSLEKTGAFVSLVNTLLPLVTTAAQPPVLVQCFNGAGPSCVLSAVMMAAEALEVEGNVSPFLLTRFIHMARPQAFRTQEEYEFMFRCLLHHAGGITDSDNTEDASKSNDSSQSTEEPGPIYNNTDADQTTDETTPIYNNA